MRAVTAARAAPASSAQAPIARLLAERPDLWRGRGLEVPAPNGQPTGLAELDRALPWGGWPRASLCELLSDQPGAGLGLLMPLLVALAHQSRWLLLVNPPLLPYAPALVARGLDLSRLVLVTTATDAPWAMEQGLRSGACAAVLAWTPNSTPPPVSVPVSTQARAMAPGPPTARPSADHPAPAAATGRQRTGRGNSPAPPWSMARLRRLQLAAVEGDAIAVLLRPASAAAEPSPAALRLAVQQRGAAFELTLLKLRGGRAGGRLNATPDGSDRPAPRQR